MGEKRVAVPAGHIAKSLSFGTLADDLSSVTTLQSQPEDNQIVSRMSNLKLDRGQFISKTCANEKLDEILSRTHFLITVESLDEVKNIAKSAESYPVLAQFYYDGIDGAGAELSVVNHELVVIYCTDEETDLVSFDVIKDSDELLESEMSLMSTLQSYLEL
ncbi:hypothetical protein [Clostridium paraputrificum]|uniref:Uncharacterized protein n=1 Tax=Clostridium paraputrificum TaxID=29363 RepID=A0A6N3F9P7_9CLOT